MPDGYQLAPIERSRHLHDTGGEQAAPFTQGVRAARIDCYDRLPARSVRPTMPCARFAAVRRETTCPDRGPSHGRSAPICEPLAMPSAMPARFAICAACNLAVMPPEPSALPVSSAAICMTASSTVIDHAHQFARTRDRAGHHRGRPHRTAAEPPSAPAACATRAASRSLSPNRISVVATESFSLIIGTAPAASNRASVADALR